MAQVNPQSSRKQNLLRLLAIAGLLLLASLVYFVRRPSTTLTWVGVFPELPLQEHKRLLVLAPHCDDETLGAAGLIQEALHAGMEVQVVVATNGDGFLFATMQDFRRIYPRPADFISMGNIRQKETLAAMQTLGLNPDQVTFLSYPDRGLAQLWNNHWEQDNPFRSPYSRADQSPYTVTYNPEANYSGKDLLSDLSSILETYRPDLIVYPHPDDYHPDHWALSAFTRLALALEHQKDPAYSPEAFAYLVHRNDFPLPKGLHPDNELFPPDSFHLLNYTWYNLPLSQEEIQQKTQAVSQYRSQLPLLRQLLYSFIRQNELFSRLDSATLPEMAAGQPNDPQSWQDAESNPIEPVQLDPVRDYIHRRLIAPTDLTALYAARDGQNRLLLCAETRGNAAPELVYTLRILAAGHDGIIHRNARNRSVPAGWDRATRNGNSVCSQVPLESLDNPTILFLGADVGESSVGNLDQIAWQQVDVPISVTK